MDLTELASVANQLRVPRPDEAQWRRGMVNALERLLLAIGAVKAGGTGPDAAGLADRVTALEIRSRRVMPEPERGSETELLADHPEPDANMTAIAQTMGTQDTDTWAVGEDNSGREVELMTDLKYDTTALTLTYRTRKVKVDPNGRVVAIAAEGSAVTVATAEEC